MNFLSKLYWLVKTGFSDTDNPQKVYSYYMSCVRNARQYAEAVLNDRASSLRNVNLASMAYHYSEACDCRRRLVKSRAGRDLLVNAAGSTRKDVFNTTD